MALKGGTKCECESQALERLKVRSGKLFGVSPEE